MPRNDRSDSLSVRGDDDPRRTLKGMQQEVELELGSSEASDTGGVEHQDPAAREGLSRGERPEERAIQRTAEDERSARAVEGRIEVPDTGEERD